MILDLNLIECPHTSSSDFRAFPYDCHREKQNRGGWGCVTREYFKPNETDILFGISKTLPDAEIGHLVGCGVLDLASGQIHFQTYLNN